MKLGRQCCFLQMWSDSRFWETLLEWLESAALRVARGARSCGWERYGATQDAARSGTPRGPVRSCCCSRREDDVGQLLDACCHKEQRRETVDGLKAA